MTTANGVQVVSCKLDPFTSMPSDVMTTRRLTHPFSDRERVHAHAHDILGTRATTEPHDSAQASPATRALKAVFLPSSQGPKNAAGGTTPRHVGSRKKQTLQDKNSNGLKHAKLSHIVAHVNYCNNYGSPSAMTMCFSLTMML